MAYIRQSPSKAGKDAIEYCRDGKFDKFWGKDSEEVSECLLVDQTNMRRTDECILESLWKSES